MTCENTLHNLYTLSTNNYKMLTECAKYCYVPEIIQDAKNKVVEIKK